MARRLALLLGLALVLTACGGKSDSSGGTSTAEWANGFCSAITTWTNSIKQTGKALQNGDLSKASLKRSAQSFQRSTKQLATDLNGLGTPDTDAGRKASDAVRELATKIEADAREIRTALGKASNLRQTQASLTTISGTLTKMGSQVSATLSELNTLDAKGELSKAFKGADACKRLVGSTG